MICIPVHVRAYYAVDRNVYRYYDVPNRGYNSGLLNRTVLGQSEAEIVAAAVYTDLVGS